MPTKLRSLAAVLGSVALTIAGCSSSAEQPSTQTPSATTSSRPTDVPVALTPVIVSAVSTPVPVLATDGKNHLAYELMLTNTLGQEVTLTSVVVRSADRALLTLAGDSLGHWTRALGSVSPTTTLGPGQAGVVWLDVALDKSATIPTELVHTVGVTIPKPSPPLIPAVIDEEVAPVAVSTRKPPVIASPLAGPNWLDGDSCCDMTAHRNALNPISGKLWGAERFAIDYVQLQPNGLPFSGDSTKVESYPYFGVDVHAVADGPVVSVVDGMPEQVPTKNPTGLRLQDYGGNHVVQDIGDGNYAFYAHLKTGSVKPKVGDKLTTGQVLGSLGNSGNTDAPHLHFHVMNTPDPLRADGIPFVIKSFRLDNRVASMDDLGPLLQGTPAPMQPGFTARDESNVSPLVLDVMTYEAK
jgi:hypothetical protein